ncbi:hypothetical protein C8F04DRAFT_1398936 [Mycena alexandri]|uniref:F-box domain-containing protein n=1 Tax=Mycena alexandri TaxID=1745969 RepID=A0AAD6WX34_9AGAR|nr:hypothetical protein C8F04DRAFT_1398936 [Mycena alexandri]
MSSVNSYPTEVLLKVFHHAVGDAPLLLGGTAVAFPISQVCQDWRQISVDSPALWEDVRFPFAAYKNNNTLMLEELLARSGTRPLTVVFSQPESTRGGRLIDFWPFFRKMQEYCSRFQAIYALLPTSGLYELNRAIGRQAFPNLVHLHITQSDNRAPVAMDFGNAPALASFHLENISYNSEYRNTSTSLRSMRFYQLRFVDIPGPVMRGLEELTIVRSPLPFFNHADPLPQSALTSLTLDGITSSGYPDELFWFLTSFDMPHLRSIELTNLDDKFGFSSQLFRALCTPAEYPALRTVIFTAVPLSHVTPEFCQALPALDTLVLADLDAEPLLSLLTADIMLCPALRELSVDGVLRSR